MLHEKGKKLETFFEFRRVAGWQDRVDAVVGKSILATVILEDVWKMTPRNAQVTKVIGEYDSCVPAVKIVRKDLPPGRCDYISRTSPELRAGLEKRLRRVSSILLRWYSDLLPPTLTATRR